MIERDHDLPISRQAALLNISRGSVYYEPRPVPAEDVDMKAARGLDKALLNKLAAGDWIDRHQNLIVVGPTGVGKSWLACALGHKACRDD